MTNVQEFRDEVKRLAECCLRHPQDFDYSKIVEVLTWTPSVPDEETGYALFRMEDGRFGTLTEWQDYTGHGCQCGSDVAFFGTKIDAVSLGLDEKGRKLLGLGGDEPSKEVG